MHSHQKTEAVEEQSQFLPVSGSSELQLPHGSDAHHYMNAPYPRPNAVISNAMPSKPYHVDSGVSLESSQSGESPIAHKLFLPRKKELSSMADFNKTETPTDPSLRNEIGSNCEGSSWMMPSCRMTCLVCGEEASGCAFGVPSCKSCTSFFHSSIQGNKHYQCQYGNSCIVDNKYRKCNYCLLQKCFQVGMQTECATHLMDDIKPNCYPFPVAPNVPIPPSSRTSTTVTLAAVSPTMSSSSASAAHNLRSSPHVGVVFPSAQNLMSQQQSPYPYIYNGESSLHLNLVKSSHMTMGGHSAPSSANSSSSLAPSTQPHELPYPLQGTTSFANFGVEGMQDNVSGASSSQQATPRHYGSSTNMSMYSSSMGLSSQIEQVPRPQFIHTLDFSSGATMVPTTAPTLIGAKVPSNIPSTMANMSSPNSFSQSMKSSSVAQQNAPTAADMDVAGSDTEMQHLSMFDRFCRAYHRIVHCLRLKSRTIMDELLNYEQCYTAIACNNPSPMDKSVINDGLQKLKREVLTFLERVLYELTVSFNRSQVLYALEIDDRVKFVKMCWSELIILLVVQLFLHHFGSHEHQDKHERIIHLLPDPIRRNQVSYLLSVLQKLSISPEDFSLIMAFQAFNPYRPNMDLSEHGRLYLERAFMEACQNMEASFGGLATDPTANDPFNASTNSVAIMESLEMEDRFATLLSLLAPLKEIVIDLDDFLLKAFDDGLLPPQSVVFETYIGGLRYQ